jgi:hypothetical protein
VRCACVGLVHAIAIVVCLVLFCSFDLKAIPRVQFVRPWLAVMKSRCGESVDRTWAGFEGATTIKACQLPER